MRVFVTLNRLLKIFFYLTASVILVNNSKVL